MNEFSFYLFVALHICILGCVVVCVCLFGCVRVIFSLSVSNNEKLTSNEALSNAMVGNVCARGRRIRLHGEGEDIFRIV